MNIQEVKDQKKFYKSPSFKVVEISGAGLICVSGDFGQTEGYEINGHRYDDGDNGDFI